MPGIQFRAFIPLWDVMNSLSQLSSRPPYYTAPQRPLEIHHTQYHIRARMAADELVFNWSLYDELDLKLVIFRYYETRLELNTPRFT
jgi:hypothetical protein